MHTNNEFVRKSSLALIEKVVEASFEFLEHTGALYQFCLHFWSYLLIKAELLDYQVKIVEEGCLDIFTNVVVKTRLNV